MTAVGPIDAVAAGMQSIVDEAERRDDASGYFAAMYLGVTRAVRAGVEAGRFTTPDRLVELTDVFATRYLDAWAQHSVTATAGGAVAGGRPPSAAWRVAFGAGATWRPTVLQHLLLGMNAHINLDLGVATAAVADGRPIDELRRDFDEINMVLAGHVQTIQDQLNRISPLYRFVDDVAGPADRAVINFSIARARTAAWALAQSLAGMDADSVAERIARQDHIVASIGRAVVHPGVVASSGLLAVRLTERRSPRLIIEVLSGR